MARPNKYTKEDLIEILKSIGKKNISKKDVDLNPNIKCGSMTIIRYFGSWKSALEASGLNEGIKTGRRPSKVMKPNLMDRKKVWTGEIDFPKTNNIENDPETICANDLIVWKGIPLSQNYLRSINEDDRDEIAKDLLNFFMDYDFIKNYKYREKEIKSSWESLKKNLTPIEEVDGVKYIKNAGASGYQLFHHFFPNITKIRGSRRKSIYDVVNSKELLWMIIRNRIGNTLLYGGEKNKDIGYCQFPMNITPSQILIGCKNQGLASMGSQFKANIAKAIYNKYVKDGDNVLDYSCGFGTRLLGLMATGKKVKYFGYEPNTETYQNLNKLSSYFNFNTEIKCCGSEEELFNVKFDFIFSSPPYFNQEIYCEEESQSYNRYPRYEDWLENYWRKTVENIKTMMSENGVFAINVGGKANEFMRKLETDMNNIVKKEGFKLFDTIWMKTSRSHLSRKKGTGENYKLEGIFFYKAGSND